MEKSITYRRLSASGFSSSSLALLLLLLTIGSARAQTASTNCFTYPDFTSLNSLNLVGAAAQVTNLLRLTPAAQDQSGAAWFADKQPCADGFYTSFRFRFSNQGSFSGTPPGADGISFSIQNLSNSAPAVEYGAFPNDVAISLNTFLDYGAGEPSDNFVGIVTNRDSGGGAMYSFTFDLNSTPIRLKDGNTHTAEIQYDGVAFSMRLDGIMIFTNVATPLRSAVDDAGKAWVGFGARTGWAWEDQDVLSWSFCPGQVAIPTTNCVSYTNFAFTTGIGLVASAAQVTNFIRLTPAAQDQLGNAWLLDKQFCASGFDTRFEFRISAVGSLPGTPAGADGIVFAVQNSGPDIADFLSLQSATTNFTGVFFNTFLNWPGCTDYQQCDVSANSVGVVTNGAYVAQTDLNLLGINLKDGFAHEGRIVFDGTAITVWLDGLMVLRDVYIPGLRPGTDSSGQGWVGFSSHTGWAWENHDILNWSFCSGRAGIAPTISYQPQSQVVSVGVDVQLTVSAQGTLPLHYQWRFQDVDIAGANASVLSLSNVQVTNSGYYSVKVTNDFGSTTSSNALLTVQPVLSFSNCIAYTNFASTEGVTVVGSAAQVTNFIRLTPAAQDQLGNAWLLEKQSCSGGFDTRFQFRISAGGSLPGTPSGADGFVFAVQNSGPDIAAFLSLQSAATNFTGVFFNTFLNWPGCTDYQQCDVSANSVGVVTNGAYVAQTDLDPLGINLKDGFVHESRIVYDGTAITVWLDGLMVSDVSLPGLKPGTDSSGQGWVGFSSHTGWAWENHDILNWSFCSASPPVINHPPVPIIEVSPLAHFAGETNLIVIAPDNTSATVQFDGSKSYDVDDAHFLCAWSEGTNTFSTNIVTSRVLAVGTHKITLRLDDTFPLGTSSTTVTVEVISSAEAVGILITMVDDSNLPRRAKESLNALLRNAAAAFDRSSFIAGASILGGFENRVKAQVAPIAPELAKELMSAAETLIQELHLGNEAAAKPTDASSLARRAILQ